MWLTRWVTCPTEQRWHGCLPLVVESNAQRCIWPGPGFPLSLNLLITTFLKLVCLAGLRHSPCETRHLKLTVLYATSPAKDSGVGEENGACVICHSHGAPSRTMSQSRGPWQSPGCQNRTHGGSSKCSRTTHINRKTKRNYA